MVPNAFGLRWYQPRAFSKSAWLAPLSLSPKQIKKKPLLCNLVLGKDKLFLKQLELNESLDSLSPLYLQ